ncbi:transcription initiation factor TFIID subunit 8, partial [Cocos nucifera]
ALISRIAVAQICLTVGYAAALRSLSDVAGRYIEILARSAASVAAVHGRNEANLLDLVRAMEELSLPRGFAGASDPTRPPLRSSVLRELRAFVRSVDEIPFPRSIRRESVRASVSPSFAQLGREPHFQHVPRWLPCFPESWERSRREGEGCGGGREREGEKVLAAVRFSEEGFLPAERERVRFRLACYGDSDGDGKKKREHGVEERKGTGFSGHRLSFLKIII